MRHAVIYFGKNNSERIFAQMLMLELEEAGILCLASSETSRMLEDIADKSVFAIVSLEAIGEKELASVSEDCETDSVLFYGTEDLKLNVPYLKRPFLTEKFVSTVRRGFEGNEPTADLKEIGTSDSKNKSRLRYDENANKFFFGDEEITLSEREKNLLLCLYRNRGNAVPRTDAAKQVFSLDGSTNVVDVYVNYLRRKIDDRFGVKTIYTVRNSGYMLK